MTKFSGVKASFKFGDVVYRCLTQGSWSGSISEAVAECSGQYGAVTHRSGGATNDTFTFDVLVDAGDATMLNALKRGTTGAFEYHPEGDTASNIEFTAANAVITASNLATGTGSLGTLSVTIGIDGELVIQVAS